MLSRTLYTRKTKKSEGSRSQSHNADDEDCLVGLAGDLPLNICRSGGYYDGGDPHIRTPVKVASLYLREVLMSSVQVMGESGLGISEKVVLPNQGVYASKRFRNVTVSRKEFGRRVEKLVQVSKGNEYLVQVRGYLYAKRIKFVLCDYYPMGSLADLLDGTRILGHTPLDWNKRLKIILHVARAIAFIHGQCRSQDKNLQLNIHGNIKSSNVLLKMNFSACLSEYGFIQLAEEPSEDFGVWKQQSLKKTNLTEKMSQKNDIHSYGMMVLDILGGPKASTQISCILERKKEIKEGVYVFFECLVEGKGRMQAFQVLELALACVNKSHEARPSIDKILAFLGDNLCIG
ncbi:hypothetical protein GIB67_006389 [Kingdonia uniflora]|uniref:Protein kinase domain-containing protein n=1 Tax=Kingdonia uniflora TaxID=39325 RepID=A0A7J7P125_9MAGN|nr:hypothetical protein GIB67_006389 [Kingdonia uniflora]